MLKLQIALALTMFCIAATTSLAQDPDRPYNTKANAELIEKFLHSDDQRMVTFGANFAAENDDEGIVTTMLQLVARWNPQQVDPYHPDPEQLIAMSEILYALIERKVQVPPEALAAVASSFPEQTLILASRLSSDDAEPLLLKWYERGEGVEPLRMALEPRDKLLLARIAAMKLSKAPPPGFAASVLSLSEERLVVCVTGADWHGDYRCKPGQHENGKCPDEVEGPPKSGWPPLFQYSLEENSPASDDDGVLVEAGGDRITWRRTPANWQLSGCYSPSPLTNETRHRLLAQMLRVPEEEMPWQLRRYAVLPWESDEKFLLELESQVNFEEGKLRASVEALYAKGLLTKAEAAAARPRLWLAVFDDRKPAEPANAPLPILKIRDPRTAYESGNVR